MGGWLPPFLRILAPWVLVLAGRRVCLLAQRVPALVGLVRLVVRVRERRRAARACAMRDMSSRHPLGRRARRR